MGDKEYTIKQASQALEVSTSTVRRRIKSGELKANKRNTEYGPTYYIPAVEIDRAIMEEEVVKVTKPVEVEDLKNTLIETVNRQNKAIVEEVMDKVGNKIDTQNNTIQDLSEQVKELTEEVKQLREQSLLDKIKNIFR